MQSSIVSFEYSVIFWILKVEVTHAYVGDDVDELSILPGDIITVVPFDDDLFEQVRDIPN